MFVKGLVIFLVFCVLMVCVIACVLVAGIKDEVMYRDRGLKEESRNIYSCYEDEEEDE